MNKKCKSCDEVKSVHEFGKQSTGDGYKARCRSCYAEERRTNINYEEEKKRRKKYNDSLSSDVKRDRWLQRTYGISLYDYEQMVVSQAGGCAICGDIIDGPLHVDHCHETGIVRGLLCRQCNMAIGLLKDDASTVRKAAAYLARYN